MLTEKMETMRKLRLILAVLAVAALPALIPASPAAADHQNGAVCIDGTYTCGHWGNRYSPPVYSNWTGVTEWIQDAGYHWQGNGFVQGWNPGAFPGYSPGGCDSESYIDGAIKVCFVNSTHPKLWVNGAYRYEATYVARWGRCDTACNHIYAAIVYVSYQADGYSRQWGLRHGFGHALGLGESYDWGLMDPRCTCSLQADQHDRDAMWVMYGSHVSG